VAELEVEIRDLSPQPTISVRFEAPPDGIKAAFDRQMPRVGARIRELGAPMAGPPFARYHEMSATRAVVELGAPIAARPVGLADASGLADEVIGASSLPGGPVAVTVHVGPYDRIAEVYDRLARWIEAEGRVAGAGPWEVYLTDPGQVEDPADWRTEVVWPLG
jgi:effector-binding domain-containing protein